MNPDNSVSVVGRDVGIDQTKTAAIACVLLIHASTGGFWSALGSADWFSTLFWSTFSRAAVPLFLMCSGALFLTPDRVLSIRKLYGKYILRIFIALVVWGIAYKLIEVARNGAFTAQAVLEGFRQLLRLEDEEERLSAARYLARNHLNVAQAEQYVERRLAALQSTPPAGRKTYIIKDVRLFLNSLDRGLRLIREAGVDARTERQETEEDILLTIRIPKQRRGVS